MEDAIRQAAAKGQWVHIINLHLSPAWLGNLSHFIKSLADSKPHASFRLWLSSAGTQQLSIGLRRACLVAGFERPLVRTDFVSACSCLHERHKIVHAWAAQ